MDDYSSYSIEEWCRRNGGMDRKSFYNLEKRGEAPRTFWAGRRRLISPEADRAWREERQRASAER